MTVSLKIVVVLLLSIKIATSFKIEQNFNEDKTTEDKPLKYYQLYLQCDKKWADVKIGTSNKKICDDGALLTTISMIVAGLPVWWVDPGVLNQWLI